MRDAVALTETRERKRRDDGTTAAAAGEHVARSVPGTLAAYNIWMLRRCRASCIQGADCKNAVNKRKRVGRDATRRVCLRLH